ncbi:hypothetical protein J4Q44_G00134890 [Coregonus suidteri]|uniref:Uncharacterized protein n=1 Tax=Coregonus suidteri TaxID=861788 RepID=A0AAN8QTH0_9TELE
MKTLKGLSDRKKRGWPRLSFFFISLHAKLQELAFEERVEVLELANSRLPEVIFDIMEYWRAIPGSPDNLAGAPA